MIRKWQRMRCEGTGAAPNIPWLVLEMTAGREQVVMPMSSMSSQCQSSLSYVNTVAGHISAAAAEWDGGKGESLPMLSWLPCKAGGSRNNVCPGHPDIPLPANATWNSQGQAPPSCQLPPS